MVSCAPLNSNPFSLFFRQQLTHSLLTLLSQQNTHRDFNLLFMQKQKEYAIEMFTSPVSYTDLILSFGPTTGIYLDGIKLMTNVRGRYSFFRLHLGYRCESSRMGFVRDRRPTQRRRWWSPKCKERLLPAQMTGCISLRAENGNEERRARLYVVVRRKKKIDRPRLLLPLCSHQHGTRTLLNDPLEPV